jgi:hypothetical protein
MKFREESVQDVIRRKQYLLSLAPYSGRNVDGKDTIFFMKEGYPGYDIMVFDSGAVIRRFGFGSPKKTGRYSGFISATESAMREGYIPYNIFKNPEEYAQYEEMHKRAASEKISKQQVFPMFDRKAVMQQSAQKEQIGYPMQKQDFVFTPSEPRSQPMPQNNIPKSFKEKQLTTDNDYMSVINAISKAEKELSYYGRPTRDSPFMKDYFTETKVPKYASKMKTEYDVLRGVERQLGITPIGLPSKQPAFQKQPQQNQFKQKKVHKRDKQTKKNQFKEKDKQTQKTWPFEDNSFDQENVINIG